MDTSDLLALQKMVEDGYDSALQSQSTPEIPNVEAYSPAKKLQQQVEQTLGMNFKAPKYDIIYKQQVEPSEVYGGFQQLTPSSADSQFLVIKIEVPGEVFRNLDVEITKNTLTLFGKLHRLHLELPHEINEKSAKAKFQNHVLTVEVRRIDNDM
eukprot:EST44433.1 pre-RNA processing PIH1/Nop17 family protein [Spironucleus salmonicida]